MTKLYDRTSASDILEEALLTVELEVSDLEYQIGHSLVTGRAPEIPAQLKALAYKLAKSDQLETAIITVSKISSDQEITQILSTLEQEPDRETVARFEREVEDVALSSARVLETSY